LNFSPAQCCWKCLGQNLICLKLDVKPPAKGNHWYQWFLTARSLNVHL
jgi:hypothetical protein